MPAVLGIDAAWTDSGSSGVALLESTSQKWRCLGVSPSYASFIGLAQNNSIDWNRHYFTGQSPDPDELLKTAQTLHGAKPDVITVDMPLATIPIEGRRTADNRVTAVFGKQGCGTHSPNQTRPGQTSMKMLEGFNAEGYSLATTTTPAGTLKTICEVYPHPALLTLLGADYRIPYKAGRSASYWPQLSVRERIKKTLIEQNRILSALKHEIDEISLSLPDEAEISSLSALKPLEDALDALICGWIGVQYLNRKALAYGDETAAVWIPF